MFVFINQKRRRRKKKMTTIITALHIIPGLHRSINTVSSYASAQLQFHVRLDPLKKENKEGPGTLQKM